MEKHFVVVFVHSVPFPAQASVVAWFHVSLLAQAELVAHDSFL